MNIKFLFFGDFLFDSQRGTRSEAWSADPVLKSEKITGVRPRKEFSEKKSRMISAREKRIQLEASLEREENTLKQIKSSMAQSNATTQAMSRSVTVFQKMSDKPIL